MQNISNKKIRLLVIMPTLNKCGGIESFYMNYYKNMSDKFSVDFITHENDSEEFRKIIDLKGDRLFVFPKLNIKSIVSFKKILKNFFRENHDYDIIHCQMANASCYYFNEAKKYNIKVRILHNHQCKYAKVFSHAVRNVFLITYGKTLSTHYLACGEDAGKFLFKKNFTIINNAIDVDRFAYDEKIRNDVREKLKLKGKYVIGNIGRYSREKNQLFLLKVFSKIPQKDNIKLLLIGNGELKEQLEEEAKKLNIYDKVEFIKSTNEIEKYYQAFDLFVLPSMFEGLPVVGIEAQAAGLPCLFSNTITSEVKVIDEVEFLPLDDVDLWVERINNYRNHERTNNSKKMEESKFNIKKEVENLEKYYISLVEKTNEN